MKRPPLEELVRLSEIPDHPNVTRAVGWETVRAVTDYALSLEALLRDRDKSLFCPLCGCPTGWGEHDCKKRQEQKADLTP